MRLLRWPSWRSSPIDSNKSFIEHINMDLTSEQSKKLEEFRERVRNYLTPDLEPDDQLVKWLIARNFDIDKATTMLLKSLEWRKNWGIDSLLIWDPPEVLKKFYPVGMSGVDKEGCPVWIIPYGYCDMKGLLQSCTRRDYIKYTFLVLEKSKDEMKKQASLLGKPIEGHIVVFDLDQFSLRHFTWKPAMDVILQTIQMYEANYPELLKCAFAINAPKLFTAAYSVIKPLLDEKTQQKVRLFGKSGWKEALLELIPEDQLPEHWGGSLRDQDGDPRCPSKICLGGDIPKSYYLKRRKEPQKGKENDPNERQFKTMHLPHGAKETIEMQVDEPGSEIRWEFQSEDFDVGFGISRILPSGDEEVLIPQQRVNSQLVPEEGALICTESALYKVIFDNEFSYMRSKKLLYDVHLVPLSEMELTKL